MSYNINDLNRNVLITPKEVIRHAPTKHVLDERMIASSIIIAEERFIRPELGSTLYDAICAQKNVVITSGNQTAMQTASGIATLPIGTILNAYELITSNQYKNLWNQFLWKVCAECVLVAAYPEGFVQFGSEGSVHNDPPAGLQVTSGFVVPLLSSLKWIVDKKVQDRIGPLLSAMHDYICRNISDYATWYDQTKCPDCNKPGETDRKWTGWATGLYEDDDNERRCKPGRF